MSDTLLFEYLPNGAALITFNRPTTRNALDLAAMQRFAEVVAELTVKADLRAVILTGAGTDAFCSGGDLTQLVQYPSAEDGWNMITLMGNTLLGLERLPVPVIAAINGYALGGGSEIALACDLRIVDERVRLGFVHIHMGITPGWGAGQRLLRLIGYPRTMDVLLQGRTMHAPELLSLGLANRVVETGTALHQALELANQIAVAPADTVRGIKKLLQAGLNQPYEAALQTERTLFPSLWASDAHWQAVEKFLKRDKAKT